MGDLAAARIEKVGDFRRFALAGRAVFTVVSAKSGNRLTFRVLRARPRKTDKGRKVTLPWFVYVLSGPNNQTQYSFLGTIVEARGALRYVPGRGSSVGSDAPSAKTAEWLVKQLNRPADEVVPRCELWHEGRCGRCRHPLTTPESIARGLGPDCAEKMG